MASTRSLLINYVGVPSMFSSLMPDIGMALLSASLRREGHFNKVLDYSSLDTIKRLAPSHELGKSLDLAVQNMAEYFEKNKFPPQSHINNYHNVLKEIEKGKSIKLESIIGEIDKEIKTEKIDFVGFKLWLGESFEYSIRIAEELKKRNPHLKVFGGGAQVDWFNEHILKETEVFDALAYGEGSETIVKLAEFTKGKTRLKDIPNLIYKNGKVIRTEQKRIQDLNTLPFPDYSEEFYPAMKGDNKLKVFMLEESRGCPNSCNFCIHPIKSGKKWRTKSAKRIVDEMEDIIKKYNSNYFRFSGSNTPSKLQFEIATEIIKRDIEVKYSSFGHINEHKHIDYKLMKQAGCHSIFFGLESGSYEIQKKFINKIIKLDSAKKILKECRDAEIKTVVSLIYPSSFETEQTKQETLNFIYKINPDSVIVSFPIIVPGTKLFTESDKFNINIDSQEKFIKSMLKYKAKYTSDPSLWNKIPYKIAGKCFSEIAKESGSLVNEFKKKEFLTQVTDEMLLLSDLYGIKDNEFASEVSAMIAKNDVDKIKKFVTTINSKVQTCNIWDEYSKSYDKLVPNTSFYKEQIQLVESHLYRAKTIIDLGCGSGRLLKKLAKNGKTCYGIDTNKNMLLSAVNTDSKGIFFSLQDMQNMNFPDKFFDAATSINSFYCVRNPEKTLKEIYRILKPQGLFIVAGPKKGFNIEITIEKIKSEFQLKGIFERYRKDFEIIAKCSRHLNSKEIRNSYSNKEIINTLTQTGFKQIKFSGNSYLNQSYFVAAIK